jgi:hypothetical protein
MKLDQIPALKLHEVWPQVLPGLEVVIKRTSPEWWPEDVYLSLKTASAFLYLCYTEGEYVGFFILVPKLDEHSGKRSLLVWIAYSRSWGSTTEGLHEIYKMAKSHGFQSVHFYSPRAAWARRLQAEGFRMTEIKFERSLSGDL